MVGEEFATRRRKPEGVVVPLQKSIQEPSPAMDHRQIDLQRKPMPDTIRGVQMRSQRLHVDQDVVGGGGKLFEDIRIVRGKIDFERSTCECSSTHRNDIRELQIERMLVPIRERTVGVKN